MTLSGFPWGAPGSFLHRIDPAAARELLAHGTSRTLRAGHRLFHEGGEDTHVEVIRRGFVKVTTNIGGTELLLAIRHPGDIVGEFAALTGSRRSATVTTCGVVVATSIQQPVFNRFLERHPQAARQVTAVVSERLRWANARRAEFATFPVHVRLARALAEIAARCGSHTEAGVVIDVDLSHTELAAMVGAAEDTVQKALRSLRARGLIRTGYRRITVVDLDKLRAMVEEML